MCGFSFDFPFPYLIGFERSSGSAGFLDLLLYKLYACVARSRVFGEKVQGYAGMLFSFVLDISICWTRKMKMK